MAASEFYTDSCKLNPESMTYISASKKPKSIIWLYGNPKNFSRGVREYPLCRLVLLQVPLMTPEDKVRKYGLCAGYFNFNTAVFQVSDCTGKTQFRAFSLVYFLKNTPLNETMHSKSICFHFRFLFKTKSISIASFQIREKMITSNKVRLSFLFSKSGNTFVEIICLETSSEFIHFKPEAVYSIRKICIDTTNNAADGIGTIRIYFR